MIYTDSDRIFNNQGLELGLLLLMLMCGVLLVFVLLYTKNTTTNMPVTNQMGIGLFDEDLKNHPECEISVHQHMALLLFRYCIFIQ